MRLRGLVGSSHSVSFLSCLFKYPNDCLNVIYDGTLAPQAKTTNNQQQTKQSNSQQPTKQAANNKHQTCQSSRFSIQQYCLYVFVDYVFYPLLSFYITDVLLLPQAGHLLGGYPVHPTPLQWQPKGEAKTGFAQYLWNGSSVAPCKYLWNACGRVPERGNSGLLPLS